jgi:hypothetical protein
MVVSRVRAARGGAFPAFFVSALTMRLPIAASLCTQRTVRYETLDHSKASVLEVSPPEPLAGKIVFPAILASDCPGRWRLSRRCQPTCCDVNLAACVLLLTFLMDESLRLNLLLLFLAEKKSVKADTAARSLVCRADAACSTGSKLWWFSPGRCVAALSASLLY